MPTRFTYVLFVFLLISCNKEDKKLNNYEPEIFRNAAIVSAHPLSTKVGVDILKSGGNAFDAAVAVHFALSVVFPYAGNLGGGGFAVILDSNGFANTLDFREKAPLKAYADMYLDSAKNVIPNLSTLGALAVGVPGSVKGMWVMHQKYGSIPWSDLIRPSIEIASKGWLVTEHAAFFMNKYSEKINEVNQSKTYLTIKDIWEYGDTIQNKQLASTLTLISKKGEEIFYNGEIADSIVATMKNFGGIITKEDLVKYEPVWRDAIMGEYKGHQIISMPPPSSGGWALISLLKMIENFPIREWGRWDYRTINTICEIEKRVFADRSSYLGDPDFYPVPMQQLLKEEYLNQRAKNIEIDKARESDAISPGLEYLDESEETTHFSIVDKYGNAVSITTTLNAAYGSKLMVNGSGFLLNNEMNDFSIKPGYPNIFGLIGAEANSIEAEKRMLSSMTPTILSKNGKPFLILGSPGGSTIITSVFQNILNVIDFGYNMQKSVSLPRFHHQWLPDYLYYEQGFFDFADSLDLVSTNQNLKERTAIGRVDAILLNSEGNWECGADPRRDDFADGY